MQYAPQELCLQVRDHGHSHDRATIGATAAATASSASASGSSSSTAAWTPVPHPAAASWCAPGCPCGRVMTIRVLVVDDQTMVRAGFRLLLADEADIEVVAEASNGRDAVAQAARFRPDVILMDIRMPEMDGLEATRRILASDADGPGAGAHHVRPRRLRLRGAARRGERLRAQGRAARAAHQCCAHDRGGRGAALPDGDPPGHPALRDRTTPGPAAGRRRADPTGARGLPADHPGNVQRRDRRGALHQRHHGQDPRHPAAPEARPPRPRSGDRPRLPDRPLRRAPERPRSSLRRTPPRPRGVRRKRPRDDAPARRRS